MAFDRRSWEAAWRAKIRARTPVDAPDHGTLNRYNNYGCRCEDCATALREQHRAWKARASQSVPEHVHGTRNGYTNYDCRCQPCIDAHTEYFRRYRAGRRRATRPAGGGS